MEKTVKKGKYRIALAAALAACALAIAGALAFYTDTETVVNKLSLDTNLDIELTEPVWDASREADPNYGMDLNPYQRVVKDPTITNKGTIPAYVAVSVSIPVFSGNLFDWEGGQINQVTDSDLFIPTVEEGWTLKDASAVKDGFRTYTYIYDQVMNQGDSKKFFNEVQVANIIDDIGINATEIVVNGFGIQAEGFANAEEAWNAYLLQNGFIDITINDPNIEQGRTYDIAKQTDNKTIATAEAEVKATVTFESVPVEIGSGYDVKDDETGEKITEFTIESITDVTGGTIKVDNPVAFAVYSADDNSLDFYKRTNVPTAGETYEGKTATAVYEGVENTAGTPWQALSTAINTTTFVDEIQPASTIAWFNGCTNLCSVNNPENLDTSKVNNMFQMFKNCRSLSSLDVSSWNVSNTTSFFGAFSRCTSLTSLDVSNWDVSKATTLNSMFDWCTSLTTLDVSNWDVSGVTDLSYAFDQCSALDSLDVSTWNTSQMNNMNGVFTNCSALTSLDVSNWDVSQVTNFGGIFAGCTNLTTLDVSNWDVSKATDLNTMFSQCHALTTLDVSRWNTANATNMSSIFGQCYALTALDLSTWNVNRVTSMFGAFSECSNLTTIYASPDADWSGIASSDNMFGLCTNLTGGNGTTWSNDHVNATYARVDGLDGQPGYFTAKAA